ncbi:hypothetical protein [Shimia thalassica]|uniref:hypothetical protein n=1 Tax=Shimia thalassica TaxID=1715693 RepID=UPI0026E3CCA9|nr:hypothetical protein [Shimia thalassica]MDO6799751.1 hypothetical protein [Shimia thalassica]
MTTETIKFDPKDQSQSHAEIQKLLRAEIDDLRKSLDDRFKEISRLTKMLDQPEQPSEYVTEKELHDIRRLHRVELTLAHVLHARAHNGPANGTPIADKQVEAVASSDLFDPKWYLATYVDLAASGVNPAEHYASVGAFEGRDPGPNFDTMAYYIANPDLVDAGWPALVHYELFGKNEGRSLG